MILFLYFKIHDLDSHAGIKFAAFHQPLVEGIVRKHTRQIVTGVIIHDLREWLRREYHVETVVFHIFLRSHDKFVDLAMLRFAGRGMEKQIFLVMLHLHLSRDTIGVGQEAVDIITVIDKKRRHIAVDRTFQVEIHIVAGTETGVGIYSARTVAQHACNEIHRIVGYFLCLSGDFAGHNIVAVGVEFVTAIHSPLSADSLSMEK